MDVLPGVLLESAYKTIPFTSLLQVKLCSCSQGEGNPGGLVIKRGRGLGGVERDQQKRMVSSPVLSPHVLYYYLPEPHSTYGRS